jgi:hypothetical protein
MTWYRYLGLVNNELEGMWKEAAGAQLRHYHGIHMVGLRKTTTFCGQDIDVQAEI